MAYSEWLADHVPELLMDRDDVGQVLQKEEMTSHIDSEDDKAANHFFVQLLIKH